MLGYLTVAFDVSRCFLNTYENRIELYMSEMTPVVERAFRRSVANSGAVVLRVHEQYEDAAG